MTEQIEDLSLVQRCQAGDRDAFSELVTRYRTRVYALVYNMVQNEQDAWDLSQDAFLKAWRSISRFRGQSGFYTWIYRIATNITIDWLRKKHIEAGVEFDDQIAPKADPTSNLVPRGEPSPSQKMRGDELRARIDDALSKLSPEHRAVVVLKEIDGLQYAEIAQVLDCSLGTVMSRLFYARKKLQTLLRDVYETNE